MARPTSKNDLIETSAKEYAKLMNLLNTFSDDELEIPFNFDLEKEKGAHWERDKNIHDVLIHLHEWHQLMLNWVNENQSGHKVQFLKDGYNWRSYGAMNQEFTDNNQDSSTEYAKTQFTESHTEVMTLVEQFSNEELFSKNVFPWVGGSTLGSYFVSVTSSHYGWACKKIRKHKKSIN